MPLDMNPDIRARWTAALRSGDYQQGQKTLRAMDNDVEQLCCLGVLCVLAEHDNVITAIYDDQVGWWAYGGNTDYLPQPVVNWAGLSDYSPAVAVSGELISLAELNDSGYTFAQIADAIDGGAS